MNATHETAKTDTATVDLSEELAGLFVDFMPVADVAGALAVVRTDPNVRGYDIQQKAAAVASDVMSCMCVESIAEFFEYCDSAIRKAEALEKFIGAQRSDAEYEVTKTLRALRAFRSTHK